MAAAEVPATVHFPLAGLTLFAAALWATTTCFLPDADPGQGEAEFSLPGRNLLPLGSSRSAGSSPRERWHSRGLGVRSALGTSRSRSRWSAYDSTPTSRGRGRRHDRHAGGDRRHRGRVRARHRRADADRGHRRLRRDRPRGVGRRAVGVEQRGKEGGGGPRARDRHVRLPRFLVGPVPSAPSRPRSGFARRSPRRACSLSSGSFQRHRCASGPRRRPRRRARDQATTTLGRPRSEHRDTLRAAEAEDDPGPARPRPGRLIFRVDGVRE
jgi:hypothetical protein